MADLHFCWLVDEWRPSREQYLRAWQERGYSCVLWHSGQLKTAPVSGVTLEHASDLVRGSDIEVVFEYEKQHRSHASCADLFRYLVIHECGGTYVDIDVLPGKAADPGRKSNFPLFGRPSHINDTLDVLEIRYILAPPRHELLRKLMRRAVTNEELFIRQGGYNGPMRNIPDCTGPGMATRLVSSDALRNGRKLSDYLLTDVTDDDTAENRNETHTKRYAEIYKLAYVRKPKRWKWKSKNDPKRSKLPKTEHPLVLVGSFDRGSNGISNMARLAVRAFERSDVPFHLVDLSDPTLERRHYEAQACVLFENPPIGPVLDKIGAVSGEIYGVWSWELPKPPERWRGEHARLSEIWCPTPFVRDIFAGQAPTRVVHHPLRLEDYESVPSRPEMRRAEFQVVTALDARSSFGRKNPEGAVEAFLKAFGGDDTAHLVVKLQHGSSFPENLRRLRSMIDGRKNITLIDEVYEYSDFLSLVRSSDVFLSLHRSEGFGIVMAEAMLMGVPVVATRYSGNMFFMDDRSAMLVPVQMVGVRDDHACFRDQGHQVWAEPDTSEAAMALCSLRYDDRFRRSVVQKARELAAQRLSVEAWFSALPDTIKNMRRV